MIKKLRGANDSLQSGIQGVLCVMEREREKVGERERVRERTGFERRERERGLRGEREGERTGLVHMSLVLILTSSPA